MFVEKPAEFDPRKYLKPAMEAMQKVCEARYEQFGAAGPASQIKPIALADRQNAMHRVSWSENREIIFLRI